MGKRDVIGSVNSKVTTPSTEEFSNELFSMTLKSIPVSHKEKFIKMKEKGVISGTFTGYIRQAIIDKLRVDQDL